jgi:mono/diheme cytochrome c family protein
LRQIKLYAAPGSYIEGLGEDLMPWPSLNWRNVIVFIVPLLGMFPFCPKAFSQDLRHGEQVAKLWCASCHSVNAAGPVLRNEAVPSFFSIAGDSATSQASLEKFLNSSHPRMPAYGLTRKDVRDVAAYILSLRNEVR